MRQDPAPATPASAPRPVAVSAPQEPARPTIFRVRNLRGTAVLGPCGDATPARVCDRDSRVGGPDSHTPAAAVPHQPPSPTRPCGGWAMSSPAP